MQRRRFSPKCRASREYPTPRPVDLSPAPAQSDEAQSDMAQSDMAQSDMAQSDMAQSDMAIL